MNIILLNLLYSVVGGVLAIGFMFAGYKAIDRLTTFKTSDQLEAGNSAVGMMVAGMFVGIGVAVGLVIGLGLN